MSGNPYEIAKGGRLCFKGGALASRSHGVDKKSKKKKDKKPREEAVEEQLKEEPNPAGNGESGGGEIIYTIDAAKKMKYEEIFPVETKKFGYDPKSSNSAAKSVEEALDDRVKKKADRYCK